MMETVNNQQGFKLDTCSIFRITLQSNIPQIIFCLPAFYQSNHNRDINSLKGPLDRGTNRAKVVMTYFFQETVPNYRINKVPAHLAETFIFNLERVAEVCHQIIVENVENCKNACYNRKHSKVNSTAI